MEALRWARRHLKIIDVHAHLFGARDWVPEWFWQHYVHVLGRNLDQAPSAVEADILPTLWDPSGGKLVAAMNEAGIDHAFVLCLDWELAHEGSRPGYAIEDLHSQYATILQQHPGRLSFGVGIDPRRTSAVELLRRAQRELGAKILKLYPPAGFYPSDRLVYPLYEACLELKMPVLFHMGPAIAPFRSKFSHPMHLDDVAADFPDLTIIAGHAGHGWWMDALAVARSKFNIYLEVSGWGLLAAHPERIYTPLR
jgi:predicted TIM-barrel fold metal-dependent hydrolase